jgi:hypothetical protein
MAATFDVKNEWVFVDGAFLMRIRQLEGRKGFEVGAISDSSGYGTGGSIHKGGSENPGWGSRTSLIGQLPHEREGRCLMRIAKFFGVTYPSLAILCHL